MHPILTVALQMINKNPVLGNINLTSAYSPDENTYRFEAECDGLYYIQNEVKAIAKAYGCEFDFEWKDWWCDEKEEEYTTYVMTISVRKKKQS